MENSLEKGQEAAVLSVHPTTSESRDATKAEIRDLPHIVGHVPFAAWTAALIGAVERFGYYSAIMTLREC